MSGLLLFLGVVCALGAAYLNTRVMGDAALEYGVYAPTPGSPEWNAKVRLRRWADGLTYASGVLAAAGVVLQTKAALCGP